MKSPLSAAVEDRPQKGTFSEIWAFLNRDIRRAAGKIRAESATSTFLRDSLMFGMAKLHLGGYCAEKVPVRSNDLSDPSQILVPMGVSLTAFGQSGRICTNLTGSPITLAEVVVIRGPKCQDREP
jgi:hypothetical protein